MLPQIHQEQITENDKHSQDAADDTFLRGATCHREAVEIVEHGAHTQVAA